jgi:hypothetical protein
MIKTGNTLLELNNDDIVTISYIAARINAKLCKIRKTYRSPKKYAEKVLSQLEHKKNMVSILIMSNFNSMDTNRLYKPSEIRNEINKQMQTKIPDDISEIVGALTTTSEAGESEYATSKDMSRALKTLENDIELTKETTKQRVKSVKGKQKIDFLGKPYFYKLPPNSESLKRIISNPKAIELVFKSLIKLGLLPHLQFVSVASFYAIRDCVKKEQLYDLARVVNKLVPDAEINRSGWESYVTLLVSLSEDQLKMLAHKLAESLVQFPYVFRFIVLIALSRNP